MSKPTVTHPQGSVEQLYQRISYVLADARSRVYRAVNFAMVQAYWEIGRIIVEEEQQGKTRRIWCQIDNRAGQAPESRFWKGV